MGWKILAIVVAVVLLVGAYRRVSIVLGADTVRSPGAATTQPVAEPLQFKVKDIDGRDVNLADYKGKVVLIVNVASKCGFTKQYEGLEKIYKQYADRGFVVLGFPANNFKGQEPGSDLDIKAFCTDKYNVTFPMFSKISVKGDDQHPLYKLLTDPATDGEFAGPIGWNFTKFLVGKDGRVFARFASKTTPEDATVTGSIEKALAQ